MPAPAFTFFIAHAGADLDFARSPYHLLKPKLPVWLDQEDLLPGDDRNLEIPRVQRRSKATVELVSCRCEALWAESQGPGVLSTLVDAVRRAAPGLLP